MDTPIAARPVRAFQADQLRVRVFSSCAALAEHAAHETQSYLQELLARQSSAAIILATGNSQIDFLSRLTKLGGVDWSQTTLFHMDEYLGLPAEHPASFRKYMRDRVESVLRPKAFHYLDGDALQPILECERYSRLLAQQPIDLCCLGIGENGHLAFNDPPVADFSDPRSVKIVKLDLACRQQQVGEGHFPILEAVPAYALTLTIPALCGAKKMICIAPEKRKAAAVRQALQGPIAPTCPASILRRQAHAVLLLDLESGGLL